MIGCVKWHDLGDLFMSPQHEIDLDLNMLASSIENDNHLSIFLHVGPQKIVNHLFITLPLTALLFSSSKK